jgi:hypothetical protein
MASNLAARVATYLQPSVQKIVSAALTVTSADVLQVKEIVCEYTIIEKYLFFFQKNITLIVLGVLGDNSKVLQLIKTNTQRLSNADSAQVKQFLPLDNDEIQRFGARAFRWRFESKICKFL